jgi:hypothetical protein
MVKCLHKNKLESKMKNNLTGEYYAWECADCGYKDVEGRSYAHKEIIEYATMLKKAVKKADIDKILKVLNLVHEISKDAIERLSTNDYRSKKYFEEVF